MKSYMAQRQWRLVGKAWEIREHLRKQAQQTDGDLELRAWLAQRTTTPSTGTAAPQLRIV